MLVNVYEVTDYEKLNDRFGDPDSPPASVTEFCQKYAKKLVTLQMASGCIPDPNDSLYIDEKAVTGEYGVIVRCFAVENGQQSVDLLVMELGTDIVLSKIGLKKDLSS